jgi:crotonobetainyl-CoA:carnitine CoA-transferase CaiB-like acyl-CoA transferase
MYHPAVDLGEVGNAAALPAGKPLDGVRILAVEQMQALPFATQLLGRLGASIVKIEAPGIGDLGRGSTPAMTDPEGRRVGATFLRNNFSKRSICIDLKSPRGRDLVLNLAPGFDVFCENLKAGSADRLGIGWDSISAIHPLVVYLSVSGFGNDVDSPYRDWPAFAPIVEAMSGIYERARIGDGPPVVAPVGALGDIGAALFATVGVLAALRQRDRTGEGQRVDIAMLDAMVAMTDLIANYWSLGLRGRTPAPLIIHGFRASDGWFILQVGREPQFVALCELIGRPELPSDPRFATREGWVEHLDEVLRPAIEAWASSRSKLEACDVLGRAGLAAGPCFDDDELVADPHVAARDMLVAMRRPDGEAQPVLVPGNPVWISGVARGPEARVPWLGEHTDEVLTGELGLDTNEIADLRSAGVVA